MNTSTTRVLVAVATVGALVGGLTACGQRNSADGAGETLTYRSVWGADEPQAEILQAAFDDFAEETGVEVDVTFLGRTGADSLATEMAAGQGPDLFDVSTDHLPSWRAQNLVAPIDEVLDATEEGGTPLREAFSEAVLGAASDGSGLWFLPHTTVSSAVWYDAAAHPELAENPPASWDEFVGTLDAAQSAGRSAICQDGTVPFYNVYWFYAALVNAGGAGSLLSLREDAAAWDRADVRVAAERVQQLSNGGYFQPSFMATKYPAAQNDWIAGGCDLIYNGTWLPGEVAAATPASADIRSFQLPVGGADSVEVGALGLGVNAKAKNIDRAKEFLAYFAQPKYQERIASDAQNIPARSDVAAPDQLRDAQDAINEADAVHGTYDGAGGDAAWWNDLFLPLSDELISGKISADEFIAAGKAKTEEHLATLPQ